MRRLYVLLPDEASCRRLIQELESQAIAHAQFHVVAGLMHALQGLPKASVWQRTELRRGLVRGLVLGGGAGLLGGLLAIAFPPPGVLLGMETLLGGMVAGAGFGAAISGLIGSQEHNREFDRFQDALAAGEVLLLIDVPRHQEARVRERIQALHGDLAVISVAKPKTDSI